MLKTVHMADNLNRHLSRLPNIKGSDDMNKEIIMLILQIIGMILTKKK